MSGMRRGARDPGLDTCDLGSGPLGAHCRADDAGFHMPGNRLASAWHGRQAPCLGRRPRAGDAVSSSPAQTQVTLATTLGRGPRLTPLQRRTLGLAVQPLTQSLSPFEAAGI